MFYPTANITLNDTHTKTPLQGNTYRPILYFDDITPRSGLINIKEGEKLEMAKTYKNRELGIYFYDDEVIRNLIIGKKFTMGEGASTIGSGVITYIL